MRTGKSFTSTAAVQRESCLLKKYHFGGLVNRNSYKGWGWGKSECRRSWRRWKGAQHRQWGSSRRRSMTVSSKNIRKEAGKAGGRWGVQAEEEETLQENKFPLRWGEHTGLFILTPVRNMVLLLSLMVLSLKGDSGNGSKSSCQTWNKTKDTTTAFIPISRVTTKQNYFVNILLLLVISIARELLQVKH